MKLDRKGYLAVEIVLASVITVIIAFFLIELTMDLVSTTDDAYLDTVLVTDKVLVTNNIKDLLEDDINSYGGISNISCTSSSGTITYSNGTSKPLSLSSGSIKYGSYTKKLDERLSNVSLSCSKLNDYVFIKINSENIFSDEDYDINILVYNG